MYGVYKYPYMDNYSPVHVVLFSLLVDQLSGLFLTFFGRPKKICSVSGNFWSVSEFFLVRLWFFGILKRNFGIPKRNLVDQKIQSLTKNSLRLNKFFFGRPKKGRNRLDNWSTKRLTKTTWTGLKWKSAIYIDCFCDNQNRGSHLLVFNNFNLLCCLHVKSKALDRLLGWI